MATDFHPPRSASGACLSSVANDRRSECQPRRSAGVSWPALRLYPTTATGQPFPRIVKEAVFDKLGLKESTYEQPLPAERAPSAATGTYKNGCSVPGKWHVYPEMAAAGLWTTPSDLATIAIEIALSRQGKANHVLSEATVQEMLRPQVERVGEIALGDRNHVDRMGLGFFLGDSAQPDLFGHIGDDEGFEAILMMYGNSGRGVAIMANSPYGIRVGNYLIHNIATEYGWDFAPAAPYKNSSIGLTDRPRRTPSAGK
jgi:CubicO group peptidase (beta-lactamase class C family)